MILFFSFFNFVPLSSFLPPLPSPTPPPDYVQVWLSKHLEMIWITNQGSIAWSVNRTWFLCLFLDILLVGIKFVPQNAVCYFQARVTFANVIAQTSYGIIQMSVSDNLCFFLPWCHKYFTGHILHDLCQSTHPHMLWTGLYNVHEVWNIYMESNPKELFTETSSHQSKNSYPNLHL